MSKSLIKGLFLSIIEDAPPYNIIINKCLIHTGEAAIDLNLLKLTVGLYTPVA